MTSPSNTKDRILDAAEAIFAERGYEAASMRAITSEAEVNLAAGHYHFGSKSGLFRATFERRVHKVNAERLELLDRLEATHRDAVPLELLLDAFLGPPLRYLATRHEGHARFIQLMGRVMSEGGEHVKELLEIFRPVQARFLPAFRRSLPHLSETDVYWRFHLLIGSMCSLMTDPARLAMISGGRCDATEAEEASRQLIAFALHGFGAAPLPHASPLNSGNER